MNILYIIGNGFDLAQGMKTGYKQFYQYLDGKKCGKSLEKMKEAINKDIELWADMEEAFGQYTSEIESEKELKKLYFELYDCLQKYLKEQEKTITEEHKKKFLNDFLSPDQYLDPADKKRYNRVRTHGSDTYIDVVTLNYTNTIESLLGDKSKWNKELKKDVHIGDILHLHGILGESIIVGVDNESQIANDEFKQDDNAKDYLVKMQSNCSMKKEHRPDTFEKYIALSNLIILYGVSLGNTDLRWWRLIGKQLKKRKDLVIIQFLYRSDIIATREHLIGDLERTQKSTMRKQFGFSEKEWTKEITDRLFFVINSNAFKE